MRPINIKQFIIALVLATGCAAAKAQPNPPAKTAFDLSADHPGAVSFSGSESAGLFTREVDASFKGVLERSYLSQPDGKFPVGFVNASPASQPWSGTMWTRDAGAFLREMTAWGYYQHACQTARCLMDFVSTNRDGYIAFPRYFSPKNPHESGTELDGHSGIIIAMVSLWQRLPATDPFRAELYTFLHQDSSPVRYLHHEIASHPLIAGSGEFGGGDAKSLHDNVVQNNLSALALLAASEMENESGDRTTARLWRKDANTLFQNIQKYLVETNGTWIWCVSPDTQQPEPATLNKTVNIGFGGLNGVASMSSDVLGFDPSSWRPHDMVTHDEKTFDGLYSVPSRKVQFDKYGIWSQFDRIHDGLLSGPSYGQGYALQTMLLFDKLDMAGHALDFLSQSTFDATGIKFSPERASPYYFYERLYSPDAVGHGDLSVGCGPLNLVNVAEPLKIARLIVGLDDTATGKITILPRLPPAWSGYTATDWPIRTGNGMLRADFTFEKTNGLAVFHMQVKQGGIIPKVTVRLPSKNGWVWKSLENVSEVKLPM